VGQSKYCTRWTEERCIGDAF